MNIIQPADFVGRLYHLTSNNKKNRKMKTFKDLVFVKEEGSSGIIANFMFDNGYGVSVINNHFSYGGTEGLYELAVMDSNGDITDDILGWLSEEDVTKVMIEIQKL